VVTRCQLGFDFRAAGVVIVPLGASSPTAVRPREVLASLRAQNDATGSLERKFTLGEKNMELEITWERAIRV
jgi:hypothetical protein